MKESVSRKAFNVVNIAIVGFLCIVMLYPYLNQLAIAFNESIDTSIGGVTIWPRVPTLDNFKKVFNNEQVTNGAFISVARTVIGTVLALVVTYSAAFALSCKDLKGRKGFNWFLSIPMYIGAGTIPVYILYRYLGLMNNFLVYILPMTFSFYNTLIIRSYLEGLPDSLEEAALIDGANEFLVMLKIILPISMPVIATVTLWVAVGHWNNWTCTLYYVTKPELYTLQYVMMQIIKQSEAINSIAQSSNEGAVSLENQIMTSPESVKAAVLIVATVPILVVYPFLQKYFIGGVTLGAVKG